MSLNLRDYLDDDSSSVLLYATPYHSRKIHKLQILGLHKKTPFSLQPLFFSLVFFSWQFLLMKMPHL